MVHWLSSSIFPPSSPLSPRSSITMMMMMMMNYNDGVYFPASKAVCGPLMSAGRKSIIKSGLTWLSEASFVFISGLKSNQLDLVVCLFSLIFPAWPCCLFYFHWYFRSRWYRWWMMPGHSLLGWCGMFKVPKTRFYWFFINYHCWMFTFFATME